MAEELDLNPIIPENVAKELKRREDAVESKQTDWMYKKYAYINISTTGKTQTMLCPAEWSIGSAPTGSHLNLYTTEGGIRKMKPTITSVKMVNEGGQDYTDSYIYEIEFAFKVFALDDLDKAEASFFKVGAEVAFDFGWAGTEIVSGVNQSESALLANVYNFSFSIEDDGGFNCSVKCMSPNGLWSKESMGGTEKVKDPMNAGEQKQASFLDVLKTAMATAFGKTDPKTAAKSAIDSNSYGQNNLTQKQGVIEVGEQKIDKASFFIAEIVSKHGGYWGLANDTETYISYTTLNVLIKYINLKLSAGKSSFKYKISSGPGGEIHPVYEIASADPTKIILPGKYSAYAEKDKAFDWSNTSIAPGEHEDKIKGILISIDYMNSIYLQLSTASTSKSGGQKAPPTISKFLQKIFNDIEQLTGGLVSIIATPLKIDQGTTTTVSSDNPSAIIITNRRKAIKPNVDIKPYEFETLSRRSITKSVSLASDFDADTLMHASMNSITSGKSNFAALKTLYPKCDVLNPEEEDPHSPTNTSPFASNVWNTQPDEEKVAAQNKAEASIITKDDLIKAKHTYSNNGYTATSMASMQDLCRKYLTQLAAKNDPKVAGSQFTEMVWVLKLGVTIDGIFGIPFLAPITIDRLPAVYRPVKDTPVKAYFSITSIEHSFDGQGGWETALDTVMRIQG